MNKKLYTNEDSRKAQNAQEMTICKLFFEKFPYFSVKTLKNNIYKAQYIYDITHILNCSQILV